MGGLSLSRRVAGCQLALQMLAVARQRKAAAPKEKGRHCVAGCCCRRRDPFAVLRRQLHHPQNIKQPDYQNQCCVLQQRDERIDDSGYAHLQGLRGGDQGGGPPIAQAHRPRRLLLAGRQGLQAAANHLGQIRGLKQCDRN